jgi:hypothetical protein
MARRFAKSHEFVAHSERVTCLALSRATARILATGGDDRSVALWSVGDPQALFVFATGGNASPESLALDANDSHLAAGLSSGPIRIWDLGQSHVAPRTLAGHKSATRCIAFHPLSATFVASGSLDTNVKVWDTRSKTCTQTYKGHAHPVGCVTFSPDGRWLASAADDGVVKVWDITAGRLVCEFAEHRAAVTSLLFHPEEYLLVSSSLDRRVCFYDVQNPYVVLGASEETGSCVRCLAFTTEGDALVAASPEVCKLWSWDPHVACVDSMGCSWGKVADVVCSKDTILACSAVQGVVSLWTADVRGGVSAAPSFSVSGLSSSSGQRGPGAAPSSATVLISPAAVAGSVGASSASSASSVNINAGLTQVISHDPRRAQKQLGQTVVISSSGNGVRTPSTAVVVTPQGGSIVAPPVRVDVNVQRPGTGMRVHRAERDEPVKERPVEQVFSDDTGSDSDDGHDAARNGGESRQVRPLQNGNGQRARVPSKGTLTILKPAAKPPKSAQGALGAQGTGGSSESVVVAEMIERSGKELSHQDIMAAVKGRLDFVRSAQEHGMEETSVSQMMQTALDAGRHDVIVDLLRLIDGHRGLLTLEMSVRLAAGASELLAGANDRYMMLLCQ